MDDGQMAVVKAKGNRIALLITWGVLICAVVWMVIS